MTQSSAGDVVGFLKDHVRLFSKLSDEHLGMLSTQLHRRTYSALAVIVKEGDPGDAMYIIRSGAVEIRRTDSETGIDVRVARNGLGGTVGEMSLLTGRPRSATVIATEHTEMFVLPQDSFTAIVKSQPQLGLSLSTILAELLEATTRQIGIEFINLAQTKVDPAVIDLIPRAAMKRFGVVPIHLRDRTLTVAMTNPANMLALQEIAALADGLVIEPRVCTERDFAEFLTYNYEKIRKSAEVARAPLLVAAESTKAAPQSESEEREQALLVLQEEILKSVTDSTPDRIDEESTNAARSDESPIARMAFDLLSAAIRKEASDIHIQPHAGHIAVRLRVLGDLETLQPLLTKKLHPQLVTRFKIMADCDITKRHPQNGRVSAKFGKKEIDFRVSILETRHGEKIVMRVLDKSKAQESLDNLIIHPESAALMSSIIGSPHGIVYVTGPTGSGKTTTLYAALNTLQNDSVNISTVEDPIEYELPGITQVQVSDRYVAERPSERMDFANVLRAFLRQDPDVILVGETRDEETARVAVQAALTGHLVFTTLHANDAPTAFTRLKDLNVAPYVMAVSAVGVVAQRLVRKLCGHCKAESPVDAETLLALGYQGSAPPLFRQVGCAKCKGGFSGRIGIYEILKVNDAIRTAVEQSASATVIRGLAIANGMVTLQEYGRYLLSKGLVTAGEVLETLDMTQ